LKHRWALAREALARLADEDHPDPDLEAVEHSLEEDALEADVVFNGAPPPAPAPAVTGPAPEAAAPPDELPPDCGEPDTEEPRPPGLHTLRLGTVLAVLRSSGARSVVDLGCGEGRLLRLLLNEPQFERIVGLDASVRALQLAARRLKLEHLPGGKRRRIELLHGALTYRDARLSGFEAAACVEVIEHLDLPRLAAFERVLFECARPRTVVLTTPNREYNALFETLPAGHLRHRDHRFEWTREECAAWAETVGRRHGYHVRFLPIGPMDAAAGAPSQMAIFELHA
jgi:3' terminal RNA ribose 2'-O-methyltransferase Hen1